VFAEVREVDAAGMGARDAALLASTEPVVLRGLVAHWPYVAQARRSQDEGAAGLLRHYRGETVTAMLGAPEIRGRFFYNDDVSGFNFAQVRVQLDAVLAELEKHRATQQAPTIYVGSTTIDTCLPGFRAENDIDLGDRDALASIWIGNRSCIAAHYDVPDNLACVVAGRRRFTLFAPNELENLYIGPLDFTPAGQPVSLVDIRAPDLARFPKYAQAQPHVAELGPGDAIFIPSMWWHHIEALEPFNVLVNYWWRQVPDYVDTPTAALMHALMTVRDLPPAQRAAWQELFRHYVFEADAATAAHIPPGARHALGPIDAKAMRAMRAQLLKKINR
jgi:hypothetical protein